MSEHRLADVAPVLNRRWRGQWAATCECGHVRISMRRGDAAALIERHAADPQPNETPARAS